jgi:hypothetical protein
MQEPSNASVGARRLAQAANSRRHSGVAAVSAVGRPGLLSGQTVKRLADEVGMAVVARVLLDHVD